MSSPYETSTDLLSDLHHRYLQLSGRFKAAWTYHQFLKGVNKVFADQAVELGTISFQSIYSELKIASKNLNVASAEVANQHLDRAEAELGRRLVALLAVDEHLTPTLLRRFFKRVRNYDARILGQLLKFYLFAGEDAWTDDRLDKADFLLTRLGELLLELDLDPLDRKPNTLRDSLRGIWQVVDAEQPDEDVVEQAVAGLKALRDGMEKFESLEDFHEKGAIQSYRTFKKELGAVFFHPSVALPIVETNLFLADRVESLYQREEQRVTLEYNKVFDLERDVPALEDTLDMELRSFRTQVEDLERSVRGQNVKIDQIVTVSESARDLIPRLEGLGRASSAPTEAEEVLADQQDGLDQDVNRDLAPSSIPQEPNPIAAQGEATSEPGHLDTGYSHTATLPAGDHSSESLIEVDSSVHEDGVHEDGVDEVIVKENAGAGEAALRQPAFGPLPDFFDAPLVPRTVVPGVMDPGDIDPGQDRSGAGGAASSPGAGNGSAGDLGIAAGVQHVDDWRAGLSPARPEETLRIRTAYAEQLGDVLRQVLQVLEETDWFQPPKLVVQIPEVRGLRLEPREVLAYRRLFSPDKFERSLEQFLVEGASLRVMMGYQAEELADHMGGSGVGSDQELKKQALATVGLASEFEKRCQHFVQEAVYARRTFDAAALQVVWMRMLREYSGLWLLLHRE